MKPPKHIRICGHDIKLDIVTLDGYWGWYDSENLTIKIDASAKSSVLADTTLHEIMHVIYHLAPLKSKANEETTVSCISTHLTAMFRDNPVFVAWWNSLIS